MSNALRTDMGAIILARHIKRPLAEAIVTNGWKRIKLIRFRVREWGGGQSGLHLAVPVAVDTEQQVSDYWELAEHLHRADQCQVSDWGRWYSDGLFLVDQIVERYKSLLEPDEINFLQASLEAQVANPPAWYNSPECQMGVTFQLKDVYG